MKCVTIILFILFYCLSQLSLLSNAATAQSLPHPLRKPGGCYDTTYGHMEGGKDYKVPGQCASIICSSTGGILYRGCGTMSLPPNCHPTKLDLSKPYSDCCPKFYCEGDPTKKH